MQATIVLTAGEQQLILECKQAEATARAAADVAAAKWQMVCNVAIVNGGGDPNGKWELSLDGTTISRTPGGVPMSLVEQPAGAGVEFLGKPGE